MTIPMTQYHELLVAAREVVFAWHMRFTYPRDRLTTIVNLIDHDANDADHMDDMLADDEESIQ